MFSGFSGFNKSKVTSDRIAIKGAGNIGLSTGNNSKSNIGLKSNTAAAINPTSDADDNPRAKGYSDSYSTSNKGGASGDGPTPGFSGSGSGVDTLNGAQGN